MQARIRGVFLRNRIRGAAAKESTLEGVQPDCGIDNAKILLDEARKHKLFCEYVQQLVPNPLSMRMKHNGQEYQITGRFCKHVDGQCDGPPCICQSFGDADGRAWLVIVASETSGQRVSSLVLNESQLLTLCDSDMLIKSCTTAFSCHSESEDKSGVYLNVHSLESIYIQLALFYNSSIALDLQQGSNDINSILKFKYERELC